jgi:ElaB/YqjD/DUF883 family membrane-anchored ribosome-binding protein
MADDDTHEASNEGSDKADQDRLEKNISAAKDDISHLAQQIADAVNALAGLAQRRAKRRFKDVRAGVDTALSSASERAGGASGAAQSAAASLGETLEDMIEERPIATLALALGLGFLIGAAWRR